MAEKRSLDDNACAILDALRARYPGFSDSDAVRILYAKAKDVDELVQRNSKRQLTVG